MSTRSPYLSLGHIGRPHGVRGEVRLRRHPDGSVDVAGLPHVYLRQEQGGEPRRCVITAAREATGGVLLCLEGIGDRESAASLTGAEVLALRDDLPPLADDELYLCDLEGCEVVTREGQRLGAVHRVMSVGPHDVLVIRDDQVERLLPFVDAFVVDTDLEARRVVVDPPEGLPEERLGSR